MKIFQVLFLIVVAFASADAMPKGQKRKEMKEKLPEGFIQELQRLSKRRLPRLDTRRKLHLMFEKYDMVSSDRRKLLFWDLINLDNVNLEDILTNLEDLELPEGVTDVIDAITGALGGGDGDGDEGDEDDEGDDEEDDEDDDNDKDGKGGKFADEGGAEAEAVDAPEPKAGKEAKQKKGGKRIRRQLYEDY